jgi:putative MATE family efflux protein
MSRRVENEIPAPSDRPAADGFWHLVAEALRGSQQDFTQGPVRRAILLLAVPMVLEMALESVFAVTDVFFVGRLGASAVATVGLTESMLAVLYAVAAGLAVGATAMVARRIGEHDRDGAARTAVQAVALGVLAAAIFAVGGVTLGPRLLALMGADPSVLAIGSGYARVMLGGSGTILLLFLLNAIFRGAGDAAIAMRVLWLANAINIVLGPCLIFGLGPFPRLGVIGAATATTIGRGTGVVFAASRLLRPGGRVSVARRHLRLEPAVMGRLLRLSVSGALQTFIGTASWIGLVRIAATFGSSVLAGYTIGIRVIIFALLPSWGLSNAAATMVGQALGAREPARAEQAVWVTAFYDCAVLTAVGVAFIVAARPIVGLFTQDPAVLAVGASCLRIVAAGFPFYAYEMVVIQSFNGAGDTWTPTVLNFVIFWLFQIPLAYVLSVRFGAGPRGIFLAITLAFSTLAVIAALLFRRGRWKRVAV